MHCIKFKEENDMRVKKPLIAVGIIIVASILVVFIYSFHEKKTYQKEFMTASWEYGYADVQELTENSDLIAVVKVKQTVQEGTIAGGIPCTDYSLKVTESILNCEDHDEIIMHMTGGIVDDTIYEIEDDPLPEKNDQFVIFAKKNDDGSYTVLGGPQGRFVVNGSKVSSLNVAYAQVKKVDGEFGIKLDSQDLSRFVEQVKGYIE